MPSSKTEAYIGLDVAKTSHAVAIAEAGRDGEVRKLGTISAAPDAVGRLVKRLEDRHSELHFCYEAGPTGYGLYRQLTQMGHACTVVAPSLVPMRSGDRVKTDQRDAVRLARLLRAGELTSVGPLMAREIKNRRSQQLCQVTQWRWHLDEVFVKINGKTHYLWRAIDHEGEVLESYVTKTRDKASPLKFLKNAMKRYGRPKEVVTDRLRSYGAAVRELGNESRQITGRHENNRAENSHLPFRRRERAMARFRQMRSLQKFAAAPASVHDHFNHDRSLERRTRFKDLRQAALTEWRELLAA